MTITVSFGRIPVVSSALTPFRTCREAAQAEVEWDERPGPWARSAQENTREASFRLSSLCRATTRSRSTVVIRPFSTTTRPLMTV